MTSWSAFVADAGELGALAGARLRSTDLLVLGTIRRDGSARVSMCEAYDVGGDLLLGMMWQSRKALDLVRDPRITAHTVVTDKTGRQGEVKLLGTVLDVPDPGRRAAYADVLFAMEGWRPPEPYHLWALDIDRAWGLVYGDGGERRVIRWPEPAPAAQ